MQLLPTCYWLSGGLITDAHSRRWGPSMIRDRGELFQQSRVICGKPTEALDQVRSITKRPMEPLRPTPAFDPSVVAAAENLGNIPTSERGGPCELGFFEQTRLAETLGDRAVGIPHGTVT